MPEASHSESSPAERRGPAALIAYLVLVACLLGSGFFATGPLEAQLSSPLEHRWVEQVVDSGDVRNRGEAEAVTFTEVVEVPGATWLRLFFARVGIASEAATGDQTLLRLTSLADGAVQVHTPQTLEQWNYSSAFFNGDQVKIELVAARGASTSRVRMVEIMVGEPSAGATESICGPTDDRILSGDARVARIVPVGCTAWLIDDAEKCFLTAGHCVGDGLAVIEFNVPLSEANGALNHPPPADQYPVDLSSVQSDLTVIGNDWGYFGAFPNGVTQLTPFEVQGDAFTLGTPPVTPGGEMIRITGFGSTTGAQGTPLTWNQVRKTHLGPLASVVGTQLTYATDTTGGDSGSPVIVEGTGEPIGIHTNAGCGEFGGANSGTSLANTGLQSALANPIGICTDGAPPIRVLPSGTVPDPIPLAGTDMAVQVIDRDDMPIAATAATLIYNAGGGDQQVAMSSTGLGLYEGTLPSMECGTELTYRFEIEAAGGTIVRHPFSPQNSLERLVYAAVGAGWDRTFHDDFETDQGWSVTDAGGLTAGAWERGVGAGYGLRADPPWDADASGQAFYTDPRGGNTDVDGGTTTLTSPQLDASAAEAHIHYWRWWSDAGSTNFDDTFVVEISGNNGATWTQVETLGPNVAGEWVKRSVRVADFVTPSAQTRLRFIAEDVGDGSIIEAAVDGVSVTNTADGLVCTEIFSDGFESGDTSSWTSSSP